MQIKNVRLHPPLCEGFFAFLRVKLEFTQDTIELIRTAYLMSRSGHADQIRTDGSRYFDHPKSSVWIYITELGGRDPRIIINLLLHDIAENDPFFSFYKINWNFGRDIDLDVRALTKLSKEKETTEEYLQRIIARGPWAIIAKLCDRLHNLRTLRACSREKQERQIDETEQFHVPLLIPALAACGEQWKECAETLSRKITNAIAKHKEASHDQVSSDTL